MFIGISLIPEKIKEEHYRRWENIKKISLDEYVKLVLNDKDSTWWHDYDSIKRSYDDYVDGRFTVRYPEGIPIYPIEYYSKVVIEANNQINFNDGQSN